MDILAATNNLPALRSQNYKGPSLTFVHSRFLQ